MRSYGLPIAADNRPRFSHRSSLSPFPNLKGRRPSFRTLRRSLTRANSYRCNWSEREEAGGGDAKQRSRRRCAGRFFGGARWRACAVAGDGLAWGAVAHVRHCGGDSGGARWRTCAAAARALRRYPPWRTCAGPRIWDFLPRCFSGVLVAIAYPFLLRKGTPTSIQSGAGWPFRWCWKNWCMRVSQSFWFSRRRRP